MAAGFLEQVRDVIELELDRYMESSDEGTARGLCRFTHARYRESFYAQLSESELASHHASIAQALRIPPMAIKGYNLVIKDLRPERYLRAWSLCQEADTIIKSRKFSHELLISEVIDCLATDSHS